MQKQQSSQNQLYPPIINRNINDSKQSRESRNSLQTQKRQQSLIASNYSKNSSLISIDLYNGKPELDNLNIKIRIPISKLFQYAEQQVIQTVKLLNGNVWQLCIFAFFNNKIAQSSEFQNQIKSLYSNILNAAFNPKDSSISEASDKIKKIQEIYCSLILKNQAQIFQFLSLQNCKLKIVVDLQSGKRIIKKFKDFSKVSEFYIFNDLGQNGLTKALELKKMSRKVRQIYSSIDSVLQLAQDSIDHQIFQIEGKKLKDSEFKTSKIEKIFSNFICLNEKENFLFNQCIINYYGALSMNKKQKFKYFQKFIKVAKTYISDKYSGNQEINQQIYCQKYQNYRTSIIKEKIQAFDQKYCLNTLQNYQNQSFYYKIVNNSLRTMKSNDQFQDFNFPFCQMYNSIKFFKDASKFNEQITLYRGARLTISQFKTIKQSKGKYIQLLSFSSFSKDKNQAQKFIRPIRNQINACLIQVKIPKNIQIDQQFKQLDHGYVDFQKIFKYQQFKQKQILFNAMNIFKVINCQGDQSYQRIELEYGTIFSKMKEYKKKMKNTEKVDMLNYPDIDAIINFQNCQSIAQKIETLGDSIYLSNNFQQAAKVKEQEIQQRKFNPLKKIEEKKKLATILQAKGQQSLQKALKLTYQILQQSNKILEAKGSIKQFIKQDAIAIKVYSIHKKYVELQEQKYGVVCDQKAQTVQQLQKQFKQNQSPQILIQRAELYCLKGQRKVKQGKLTQGKSSFDVCLDILDSLKNKPQKKQKKISWNPFSAFFGKKTNQKQQNQTQKLEQKIQQKAQNKMKKQQKQEDSWIKTNKNKPKALKQIKQQNKKNQQTIELTKLREKVSDLCINLANAQKQIEEYAQNQEEFQLKIKRAQQVFSKLEKNILCDEKIKTTFEAAKAIMKTDKGFQKSRVVVQKALQVRKDINGNSQQDSILLLKSLAKMNANQLKKFYDTQYANNSQCKSEYEQMYYQQVFQQAKNNLEIVKSLRLLNRNYESIQIQKIQKMLLQLYWSTQKITESQKLINAMYLIDRWRVHVQMAFVYIIQSKIYFDKGFYLNSETVLNQADQLMKKAQMLKNQNDINFENLKFHIQIMRAKNCKRNGDKQSIKQHLQKAEKILKTQGLSMEFHINFSIIEQQRATLTILEHPVSKLKKDHFENNFKNAIKILTKMKSKENMPLAACYLKYASMLIYTGLPQNYKQASDNVLKAAQIFSQFKNMNDLPLIWMLYFHQCEIYQKQRFRRDQQNLNKAIANTLTSVNKNLDPFSTNSILIRKSCSQALNLSIQRQKKVSKVMQKSVQLLKSMNNKLEQLILPTQISLRKNISSNSSQNFKNSKIDNIKSSQIILKQKNLERQRETEYMKREYQNPQQNEIKLTFPQKFKFQQSQLIKINKSIKLSLIRALKRVQNLSKNKKKDRNVLQQQQIIRN